jgi:phage terminase small subunit
MKGRLPKPAEQRILDGNPGRRPVPKQPEFRPGVPDQPARMSTPARRIWDELVDEMAPVSMLRRVDRRALWQLAEDEALIAEAYAGIWKMTRVLKKKAAAEKQELPAGALFSLLGMKQGRLAMAAIRDLAARVIIERREFGLTPSSRSRVPAGDKPTDAEPDTLDGNWVPTAKPPAPSLQVN